MSNTWTYVFMIGQLFHTFNCSPCEKCLNDIKSLNLYVKNIIEEEQKLPDIFRMDITTYYYFLGCIDSLDDCIRIYNENHGN